MPWTKDSPPKAAKNWTVEEQGKCVSAANAALAKGATDEDAIFACIAAAGKSKKGKRMSIDFTFPVAVAALKRLVGKTPKEERMERTMIQRQKDGTYRWFTVSGSSALNKDGEIDSRALYDSFIAIARATGKYPKRDFMHLGSKFGEIFDVGQADFLARDGNFLISSGVYYDTELARAEIAARERIPDDWGDSNEFMALEHPEIDGEVPIFHFGYLKRIATVPKGLAASHFTSGTVKMEVDRMMEKEQFEVLAVLMGDEELARKWVQKYVGDPEEALAKAGTMTRTTTDGEDWTAVEADQTAVEIVEPEEAVVEAEATEAVVEYEIDDALVDEIVTRVKGDLESTLAEIGEKLEQIDTALKTMAENAESGKAEVSDKQAEVEQRLVKLEEDEGVKQQTWFDDMPRKVVARATYRPRENAVDEGGDQVSADERLSNWDTKNDEMYTS